MLVLSSTSYVFGKRQGLPTRIMWEKVVYQKTLVLTHQTPNSYYYYNMAAIPEDKDGMI